MCIWYRETVLVVVCPVPVWMGYEKGPWFMFRALCMVL